MYMRIKRRLRILLLLSMTAGLYTCLAATGLLGFVSCTHSAVCSRALASNLPLMPRDSALDGTNYYYADAMQSTQAEGASGNFNQPSPTLGGPDSHTLAELAVESNSANGLQIVEVGWTVDRGVNGDEVPHLFVYHWINGLGTCYNACGFVQVSQTLKPGMKVTVDSQPGTTHQYAIRLMGSDWWVGYEGQWIGYFPGSLWNNAFTSANLVQWFGEVATARAFPCSQMGDGQPGSSDQAAVINNMSLYVAGAQVQAQATPGMQGDPYYTVGHFQSTSFTYGGPGASQQQCSSSTSIPRN